jgi:hypothetical protein
MDTADTSTEIDSAKVEAILDRFAAPEEISRIETIYGTDHTGDPAVFLTFHVKDQAKISQADIRRLSSFLSEVTSALLNEGIGGFAYTRLE